MDAAYDWSTFTKRINIKSTEPAIYNAWTTQQGLEKWFLRVAAFSTAEDKPLGKHENVHIGDTYKWHWHGYPDTTVEYGTIKEANGKDFFCFTFNSESAKTDMQVSVSVREEENEMIVELKQFNIPTDQQGVVFYHLGCMEGWTFYLANLKSILEGGIDLRNKNEKLQKMINS